MELSLCIRVIFFNEWDVVSGSSFPSLCSFASFGSGARDAEKDMGEKPAAPKRPRKINRVFAARKSGVR